MQAKQLVRPLVSVLIIGSSVCCLYNVMADDTELRREAGRVACGEGKLVAPWRVGRYPVWQTYGFQCPAGSVDVTCTRSLYLLGEYTCTWDSGNPPLSRNGAKPPASTPPAPRTSGH